MSNQISIVALLLIVAGAGVWFFFGGGLGAGAGLDAAGQAIVQQVESLRSADAVDKAACRELLKEIGQHPQSGSDPALARSEAWLQLALGRSRRALDALDGNLVTNAAAADLELAAAILTVRFHETGDLEIGHRGATFAEDHFAATGDKASLFLAWQLRLRMNDAKRAKAHAATLQARFGGSPEARLTKVLADYPRLKETAAGAHEELLALEKEFTTIPLELDLALALFEMEAPATIGSAAERTERVLRAFPSSIPARTFKALCLMGQQQFAGCKKVLEPLLRRHPKHWRAPMWQSLLDAADAALAKKNG